MDPNDIEAKNLTISQKARAERNRLKALTLKESRLIQHPYVKIDNGAEKTVFKVNGTRFMDSGGGFLIEENNDQTVSEKIKIIAPSAPIIMPSEQPSCLECQMQFPESYLFQTFDYAVCDNCRDNEDKHSLITKTEAKNVYLLKDCDLDKREPILRYIIRKNPHNVRWGEMKLYLHVQIEKRALEVWGSEDNLLKEKESREEKKDKAKAKKYSKELQTLRMNVRGSLFDRKGKIHSHTFGTEIYNEDEDTYSRSCTSCPFVETFEKM